MENSRILQQTRKQNNSTEVERFEAVEVFRGKYQKEHRQQRNRRKNSVNCISDSLKICPNPNSFIFTMNSSKVLFNSYIYMHSYLFFESPLLMQRYKAIL